MIHDGKPSIDDVMAHYGIKGMKWGVHKKEDPSSGHGKSSKPLSDKDAKAIADFNELSKKWMAATPPENKTHAEAAQSLTENHHKFNAKFQPDDHSPDSSVGEHHQLISRRPLSRLALALPLSVGSCSTELMPIRRS